MVFSAAGLTAGLDSALKVNQHGVREAKFPDTAGDLGHLGLRMRPRVARVGDQSADFPPFDSDLSRARARAGVAGVEVSTGGALVKRTGLDKAMMLARADRADETPMASATASPPPGIDPLSRKERQTEPH